MRTQEQEDEFSLFLFKIGAFLVIFFAIFIPSCSWFILPSVNVYIEQKGGEAELARADSNRKIRVLEAEAEKESAKALAEAEIIRAHGVAKANEIIGGSLTNNEAYLRYLWIQGLQNNAGQTVYIPTEAGLPILEANPNIRGKL